MKKLLILVLSLLFLIGCGGAKEASKDQKLEQSKAIKFAVVEVATVTTQKDVSQKTQAPQFKPFYIYANKGSRSNHYTPSGFMPNGKCLSFADTWTEDCYSGSSCMKIEYDVECSRNSDQWAGIYWLNPPNNWGNRKGGYNLTGAEKLTFWARGEKGGEQINEITIGGLSGDYSDSDVAVIGPIILMPEWRQYTIDLRGKDLSYISGGFSWSTSAEVNPLDCVFYLDEMKFE